MEAVTEDAKWKIEDKQRMLYIKDHTLVHQLTSLGTERK